MKYLSSQKETVRQLRRNGLSLNQIHEKTSIPRTTIRTWITDIKLSKEQLIALTNRIQKHLQAGRIRSQAILKKKRLKNESRLLSRGSNQVGNLSRRELFLTGIALYWAEGFKNRHEHRLGFCNSDPSMINFYISWLEKCLKVKKTDLVIRITINSTYENKSDDIEQFWSDSTKIPKSQFTKPFYQHSLWKKTYETENYHGVLRVHVRDSLNYLLEMRGWIEGLRSSVIK